MTSPTQNDPSSNEIRGIIKRKHLFIESELPKEGWIQTCFLCGTDATSHLLDYTTIKDYERYSNSNVYYDLNIAIHTCPRCSKKLKKDRMYNRRTRRLINEYIRTNIYSKFIGR